MIQRAAATSLFFVVVCVCFIIPFATQAGASELQFPPVQFRDDYGEALPYAVFPITPAGLCLIDSGLNLNPDTAPVTVYRGALDGGTPDDVDPMQHGTRMAMEAAAVPNNDWGTVGAAPGAIRIVSIRVMEPNGTVSFTGYKQAILRCRDLASVYNIKVISLSLGYPTTPTEAELQELENAAVAAQSYGISIFAAAGNEGRNQLDYPAALPPIVAVGAAGENHQRCPFSNWGPGLLLLAPGCNLDTADPSTGEPVSGFYGTSQATADTAAVVGALDAYRPDLSPEQDRQLLTTSMSANGGELDVTALFEAAGLGSVIANGKEREPRVALQSGIGAAPSIIASVPIAKHVRRLPRPRVRLRHRRSGLLLVLLNRPQGAHTLIKVLERRRHERPKTIAEQTVTARTIPLKTYHRVVLALSYVDPINRGVTSPTTNLQLP
jgi:hypothetical protein